MRQPSRSRARRLGLTLTLALAAAMVAGCNAGRSFIASPGDYADYRSVRIAPNAEARLAAAWEYLKARPDGQYAERLTAYFTKAEPVFFKVKRRSIGGLEAYLRALPDGPHAADAVQLLVSMRDERRRDSIDNREALATTMRLDGERTKREAAAELLLWWSSAFMDPLLWKGPLSDAPAETLVRYQLSLPQPRCEPDAVDPGRTRCVKPLEQRFRAVGRGKLKERTLAFLIEVELDERWRVERVTVSGSGALLATEEARHNKALEGTDREQRRAAASFVAKLTASLFEREVACNGGTDAQGRTVLSCEGLRFALLPGRDGGDDVMRIDRVSAPDDDDDDDAPDPAPSPKPPSTEPPPKPAAPMPASPPPSPAPDDDVYD